MVRLHDGVVFNVKIIFFKRLSVSTGEYLPASCVWPWYVAHINTLYLHVLSCNSRTSVSWMVLSYSLRALPMVGHHGIHEIFILFTSLRNTLPETNSLHLKMDGWKMKCLFGMVYFQLRTVSFRMFPHVSNKKGPVQKERIIFQACFFPGRPSCHFLEVFGYFCRKKTWQLIV